MSNSFGRRVAILAIAAVVPISLVSCATESTQTTNTGTRVVESNYQIENATIVAGNPGSGKASFLGTVVNLSGEEDEILGISSDGIEATVDPDKVVVEPKGSVKIQTGTEVTANFADFTADTGTWVPVSIVFRKAGLSNFEVLVVPPIGYYEEAAPEGTKPQDVEAVTPPEEEGDAGELEGHNSGSTTSTGTEEETDATKLEEAGTPASATPNPSLSNEGDAGALESRG
ncbi:MAG: hypothetical protein K0U64_00050 [Actinomycetia bacterium]|nr:hypothetical protein [Actinomycetes bacterium]